METQSRLHGKSQPRLLQTYLFMKYEVMKKVLNPTSVNSNSSQQVSRGPRGGTTPASTPGRGQGTLCHPLTPPRAGQREGSTAQPAQCKAQSFAGDFKWLLVKENSQRWEKGVTRMLTRMGKG